MIRSIPRFFLGFLAGGVLVGVVSLVTIVSNGANSFVATAEDTYRTQRATLRGLVSADSNSPYGITFGISVTGIDYVDPAKADIFRGYVSSYGKSGSYGMWGYANPPQKIETYWTTISGIKYRHIKITTTDYRFRNLIKNEYVYVYAVVDATQKGKGTVGFTLYRIEDRGNPNATPYLQSKDGNGQYTEFPVITGQLNISFSEANQSPTVLITAPTEDQEFTTTAVEAAANASDSDGTIAKVAFYVDGTLKATDTTTPYSAQLTALTTGVHALTAKATDNGGATTTSAAVHFAILENQAPVVSITAPVNNQRVPDRSATDLSVYTEIDLSADASDRDGTVTKVEFFDGTTKVGEDTTTPYSIRYAPKTIGDHSLTAKATDDGGRATTSAAIRIEVYIQTQLLGPPGTAPQ